MSEATPLDILLVCGSPVEQKALAGLLQTPRRFRGATFEITFGRLHELAWGVVQPQPGPVEVLRGSLRSVIETHQPTVVAFAELAVALADDLPSGTVLAAEEIVLRGREQLFTLPIRSNRRLRARPGKVASVERWPARRPSRENLRQATGADGAAVRCYSVCAALSNTKLDMALFFVAWPADRELTHEVLAAFGPTVGFRVGAAVAALSQGPEAVTRLTQARAEAARVLEQFSEEITSRLAAAL